MSANDVLAGKGRATKGVWIGRGMSALVVAFLLLASGLPKLFMPSVAHEAMEQLGWSPKHLFVIAVIEIAGAFLYAFPRTAGT